MGYNRQNYARIRQEYEQKRLLAVQNADTRREELHDRCPELATLDTALSKTGLKLFRAACDGREQLDSQIDGIQRENTVLLEKRAALLATLGVPADYTDVHYDCAACSDTGFLPTMQMCPCMKKALTLAGFRSSGLDNLIKRQSFENFSLSYYRGDPDAERRMARNLEMARAYADGFSLKSGNLLLLGGTGLGKTHLSTAIGKVVIERGFDVLYDSFQNVVSDFEFDKFKSNYHDREDIPRGEKYLACDLLILDDLGTEIGTQFTQSCLYHIVNTRLNRMLPTVISTNLTQRELLTRYGERIASRFFGEYEPLQFVGTDIRLQRK